jgi:glycerophosphoryl diester phosphodiesterase
MTLSDILGPLPWIAGHRGACADAPENTLESFRLAVEQGAVMVELDLQLTRDGCLIAAHDWDLKRTARSPLLVETSDSAEIRPLNVAAYLERSIASFAPFVEEIFEALEPDFPLNLELKRRRADRNAFAEAVARAIEGRKRVIVSSFDWPLLLELRRRAPETLIAPLCEEPTRELLAVGEELGAIAIHTGHDRVKRPFVDAAAAAGRPVLVYTVDDPGIASAQVAMGVAGFFTNVPARLRAALGAR